MTDRDVEAAVEAGVLAAGMENARNKRRPAHVLAASQDGGKDFKSEVEWLLQVVRAPLPSNPSASRSLATPSGRLKAGPA